MENEHFEKKTHTHTQNGHACYIHNSKIKLCTRPLKLKKSKKSKKFARPFCGALKLERA